MTKLQKHIIKCAYLDLKGNRRYGERFSILEGGCMIAEVHGAVYYAHGLITGGILVAFAMFIGRK